jgi:SAM-dependent methyltransferase
MPVPNDVAEVERDLLKVYQYCPPTRTHFANDQARVDYQKMWGDFFASFGVPPETFAGQRVLDVGCGSGEKLAFYHDWGGRVTGIDLTPRVLQLARETLADRQVELINVSLFEFDRPGEYDIAVIDGVSFITANTLAALQAVVRQLKPGGLLIFSITNVWGSFWWFRIARLVTGLLGGNDFHERVRWGRRLFLWTRRSQEGTAETLPFYRSEDSWAYDWFGPPRYHLHSPNDLRRWLDAMDLSHHGSSPSLLQKDEPVNRSARIFRAVTGSGATGIGWYWWLNGAPNMAYVAARTKAVGSRTPR